MAPVSYLDHSRFDIRPLTYRSQLTNGYSLVYSDYGLVGCKYIGPVLSISEWAVSVPNEYSSRTLEEIQI